MGKVKEDDSGVEALWVEKHDFMVNDELPVVSVSEKADEFLHYFISQNLLVAIISQVPLADRADTFLLDQSRHSPQVKALEVSARTSLGGNADSFHGINVPNIYGFLDQIQFVGLQRIFLHLL